MYYTDDGSLRGSVLSNRNGMPNSISVQVVACEFQRMLNAVVQLDTSLPGRWIPTDEEHEGPSLCDDVAGRDVSN